jgi:hypothetical protein
VIMTKQLWTYGLHQRINTDNCWQEVIPASRGHPLTC